MSWPNPCEATFQTLWRRSTGFLFGCVAAFLAIFCFVLPASVLAHPFAFSTFEATTQGKELEFFFRLDGTSARDLVNRIDPEIAISDLTKEIAVTYREEILEYFDERFEVRNRSKVCQRQEPKLYFYHQQENRLQLRINYICPAELSVLDIRSTLFMDEDTPHQIIGTLRHVQALEKYFFTGGERAARIDLSKLKQQPSLPPSQFSGIRMATPPPGTLFGEAAERAKAAKAAQEGESPANEATQALDAKPNAVASVEAQDTATQPSDDTEASAAETSAENTSGQAKRIDSTFLHFISLGVEHILGGYDHVLFVLSLLAAVLTLRQLLWIVSSFTLAHSITLALGTLQLVEVSPKLVEPVIALSIIYVALENVLRKEVQARPKVTFGFGLVHGLGFSYVLSSLGLASDDYIPSLVGFNIGVELGQLMIVAPIFPVFMWLRRKPELFRRVNWALSIVVTLLAGWWFIERVFL